MVIDRDIPTMAHLYHSYHKIYDRGTEHVLDGKAKPGYTHYENLSWLSFGICHLTDDPVMTGFSHYAL